MRFRATYVLILASVAICVPVWAAGKPAGLPIHPGGKVQMEVNLTSKDFLPAVQQGIMVIPSFLKAAGAKGGGSSLSEESVKELQRAVAALTAVSVVSYQAPPLVKANRVLQFYQQKLGLGVGWLMSVRVDGPKAAFRLYARPNLEGIFGIAVVAQSSQVIAFRTQGRIDLAAISKWMSEFMPKLAELAPEKVLSKPEQNGDAQKVNPPSTDEGKIAPPSEGGEM